MLTKKEIRRIELKAELKTLRRVFKDLSLDFFEAEALDMMIKETRKKLRTVQ